MSDKSRQIATDEGWSSLWMSAGGVGEIISVFSGECSRITHAYHFPKESCGGRSMEDIHSHVIKESKDRLEKEGVRKYSLTICYLPQGKGVLAIVSITMEKIAG